MTTKKKNNTQGTTKPAARAKTTTGATPKTAPKTKAPTKTPTRTKTVKKAPTKVLAATASIQRSMRTIAKSPSNDDIAKRAYEIFQQRGHAHGHDREDWLRAEAELRNADSQPSS